MTVDAKGANGHVHWIVATLRGKFDDDTLLNMMSPLHWVAGSRHRPASLVSCIIFLLLCSWNMIVNCHMPHLFRQCMQSLVHHSPT